MATHVKTLGSNNVFVADAHAGNYATSYFVWRYFSQLPAHLMAGAQAGLPWATLKHKTDYGC